MYKSVPLSQAEQNLQTTCVIPSLTGKDYHGEVGRPSASECCHCTGRLKPDPAAWFGTEVEQTPPVEAQVAAVQQGTNEMSCPSDWHPDGSRCIRFVSIPQSWSDSEQNCLALGGNLASVNNLLEYQFMQALTKNTNGHLPDTWIGGFDAVKEGLWMWSDGSRFDYTNWNTGEPNNAGEGEDCLQMNAASEKLWFDVPCEWKFTSLCSRRM